MSERPPYAVMAMLAVCALALASVLAVRLSPHILQGGKALVAQSAGSAVAEASTTPLAMRPSVRVPILVYHIVRPSYPSDTPEIKKFAVTPQLFDEEMGYLQANGYHVIPFSVLEAYFYRGAPLPERPVIINFDDGWEDQYLYAFPILVKYHFTATFFVPSNFPGNKSFLSWDELKAMLAAGMTVGDHTKSHPYLTKIESTSTLVDEIEGSKRTLEAELGVQIHEFDYPFGAYDPRIVQIVEDAGYKLARSDSFGLEQSSSDLFSLKALNAPTTMADFERFFPAK